MQELHLVGMTRDLDGLIFSVRTGSKSGSFVVPIDLALIDTLESADRLRREADSADGAGFRGRRPQEPRAESQLTPREMQARLRAGHTVEEVAKAAGVHPEWVERFEAPVAAERSRVVETALGMTSSKARVGESALPLAESVRVNLHDKGVAQAAELEGWSAQSLDGTRWLVRYEYVSRQRRQKAEWELDFETRSLTPRNRTATELGYVNSARRRVPIPSVPRVPASERNEIPPRPLTMALPVIDTLEPEADESDGSDDQRSPGRIVKATKRRSPAKKTMAKKTTAKKTVTKKAAARKSTAKKSPAKRTTARKVAARRAPAKKATTKKSTTRKAPAKRAVGRKASAAIRSTTRKATARKTTARKVATRAASARRSAPKKVTARKATAKRTASRSAATRTAATRKTAAARKTTARRAVVRKAPARKTTPRKTTARKAAARKTTARKTTARKTAARKTVPRKATARRPAARKATARTRSGRPRVEETGAVTTGPAESMVESEASFVPVGPAPTVEPELAPAVEVRPDPEPLRPAAAAPVAANSTPDVVIRVPTAASGRVFPAQPSPAVARPVPPGWPAPDDSADGNRDDTAEVPAVRSGGWRRFTRPLRDR